MTGSANEVGTTGPSIPGDGSERTELRTGPRATDAPLVPGTQEPA
jgi:hypothetical protein